jgi:hypothetical protein
MPIFPIGGERSRPDSRNRWPIGEPRSPVMTRRGERGIWQRYWEQTIRDDRDFAAHLDETHFNPLKHGSVAQPGGLAISPFCRSVASGIHPADWRGGGDQRNRRANGSEIEAAEPDRATRPLHWPRAPIHKSRRNALRCSALRLLYGLSIEDRVAIRR